MSGAVDNPCIELARELCHQGTAVRDEFFSPAEWGVLAACAAGRQARGEFREARIGAGGERTRNAAIRGDSICWLAAPLYPAERLLLERLESLRLALNREFFLGLFDLEMHYACYPPGSAYARHVDQPRGSDARRVAVILYLNAAWDREAGGELRIFEAGGTYRDISPRGGRLVCFMTEGRVHEVLPAARQRWSASGWFRVR